LGKYCHFCDAFSPSPFFIFDDAPSIRFYDDSKEEAKREYKSKHARDERLGDYLFLGQN
jgi:hypothetical protein